MTTESLQGQTLDGAAMPLERARSALRACGFETAVSLACTGVLATVVWSASGIAVAAGLVGLAAVFASLRFVVARHLLNRCNDGDPPPAWQTPIAATLLLSGALAGAALFALLSIQPVVPMAGFGVAMAAIMAALVVAAYQHGLTTAAFGMPAALGAVCGFCLGPLLSSQNITVLAGVVVLGGVVIGYGQRRYAALAVTIEAFGVEHGAMLKASRDRMDELSKLKLSLKTTNDRKAMAEQALKSTEANLEVVTGKAEALAHTLQRVSPLDSTTGLLNAQHIEERIDQEWARMLRAEQPLTLVHMELDSFEAFAETYGSQAYESCLKKITEVIVRSGRRPGDCAGRVGDGKFAILYPSADTKHGEALAERIRARIAGLSISNAGSPLHTIVTASFGVATMMPNRDCSMDELLQRADSSLYEASFRGGNKVVRYRTINNIRLERWNHEVEGELSGEGLVRKLALWGYEPEKKVYEPGFYQSDRRMNAETVDAVVEGSLRISLDGESRVLRPGDCLFIPKGLTASTEVVGKKPVVCLEAYGKTA
ncbi:MAG: diguanylate cyclase [Gammaproteobacteria bacterium]|nr:diguanylate cyclase [Gammaproteobacteria bacterium]